MNVFNFQDDMEGVCKRMLFVRLVLMRVPICKWSKLSSWRWHYPSSQPKARRWICAFAAGRWLRDSMGIWSLCPPSCWSLGAHLSLRLRSLRQSLAQTVPMPAFISWLASRSMYLKMLKQLWDQRWWRNHFDSSNLTFACSCQTLDTGKIVKFSGQKPSIVAR